MWVSSEFPTLFPLSIPHHGGRDLAIGTQRSILDQLEDDVLAWEGKLENEELERNSGSDMGEDDGSG